MAEGIDYFLAAIRKVTKKQVVLAGAAAAVSSFAYLFPMTAAIVSAGLCGVAAAFFYPTLIVKTMEMTAALVVACTHQFRPILLMRLREAERASLATLKDNQIVVGVTKELRLLQLAMPET